MNYSHQPNNAAPLITSILLAIILAACTTGMATYERPITIGGAFALTGDAADLGRDELRAAQLAIDEQNARGGIDGAQIKFIAEDTATDGATTLSAVRKLIDLDNVPAIIGPTWGDSFADMTGPVAEEANVVQITPSGAISVAKRNADYTYLYSTFYTIDAEVEAHMTQLQRDDVRSVVVIHDQDPYDTRLADAYITAAKQQGIDVRDVFIVQNDNDYRTVLLRAKQHDPDLIFVQTLDVQNMGAIMTQREELGLRAKFASTAAAQTNTLLESYAQYAEGRMIVSSPNLKSDAFTRFEERFEAKYGERPFGSTAAGAYDATRMIITALQQGARTGPEIKRELDTMRVDGTIADTISFNEDGGIDDWTFAMRTVKDGRYVPLNT
jgi:branched-chain amino acid transport system substrate-binding protein